MSRARWRFCEPDVIESRGDRNLMVWGDRPFWTVVDDDLRRFLGTLDGSRSLKEVIGEPEYALMAADLKVIVEELSKRGVVSAEGVAAEPVPVQSSLIDNVALSLTSACNLRCTFCYARDALRKRPKNELSASEIVGFLKRLKPMLSPNPTLTVLGGEPSLRADTLFEVVTGAEALGIQVIVSTNGQNLDSAFAKRAAASRTLVQVSLDGATSQTHDAIRGKGTFVKALESIRLLVGAGVPTTISMVCHSGNLHQLGDYFELGHDLGVAGVRFIPLKCIGGGVDGAKPVSIVELLKTAAKLFRDNPEYRRLAGTDALSVMAGTCSLSAVKTSCGAGVKTVALNADGSVYPCLNLQHPKFLLGNVRDADFDFDEAWESAELKEFRCETSVDSDTSPCRNCPVRYWCLAGCRGENFAASGEVGAKSPTCAEQRRMILETLWLLSEQPELAKSVTSYC